MQISDKATLAARSKALYFFPDQVITSADLRGILDGIDRPRRAWAISHLLRYAQWDEIWVYVSRDEIREAFTDLDLPDRLRSAWARLLRLEQTTPKPR